MNTVLLLVILAVICPPAAVAIVVLGLFWLAWCLVARWWRG